MIVVSMFLMVLGFMLNVKDLQAKGCAAFYLANHNSNSISYSNSKYLITKKDWSYPSQMYSGICRESFL